MRAMLRDKEIVPPPLWKPGVVWNGQEGELTSRPVEHPVAHWDDIISSWGYDPKFYEIIEPVRVSTWDTQTKEGQVKQLWSYKAGIRAKHDPHQRVDYAELVREIKRHRPLSKDLPEGDSSFVVCIADTQFGKADGDGLQGTIGRFIQAIDDVEKRIRELRAAGRKLGTLVVVGLGDILESCVGQYPAQAFSVEINRRQQIRIARRLIRDAIARWSKHFNSVQVTAVPGNHGENRLDGKVYTTPGDNDDVAIFETVADILSANKKAYGHVEFFLPEDQIYTVLNVSGTICCFVHGHITKGGGSPQTKLKTWWQDQTFGEQPPGMASILLSGHYHHTSVVEFGKKTHIQCPSLDGGSDWWLNLSGEQSPPGILTLVVGKDVGLSGWNDLKIL